MDKPRSRCTQQNIILSGLADGLRHAVEQELRPVLAAFAASRAEGEDFGTYWRRAGRSTLLDG
ncbi:hypothetical protein M3223_05730 [Paenibacillus pasadenensis]|uniref:hypothetical protein n=1 Tax=Paenibacillus pasadenensis TaxID=217090 RepID=UPI00203F3DED|nr:hypothetical protein [Paenibacillus pasadenensis]MCM3746853.1 hypothetical protein [Paenibacillus pasadenensis]